MSRSCLFARRSLLRERLTPDVRAGALRALRHYIAHCDSSGSAVSGGLWRLLCMATEWRLYPLKLYKHTSTTTRTTKDDSPSGTSHTRARPHLRPLGQPTRPDTPQSKCDSSQILLTSATSEKACRVIPRPSHLAQIMSSGEPISSSPRTSDHLVWSSSRPGGMASCRQSCRHSSRRTRGAESSGRRRSAPCSPACPSRPDRGP